jgi:hypothetical protein
MGRRHKEKGRLPAFVPMFKETITSPAWRALSHGARSLFLALKFRYNSEHKNNGKIYISTRDAADELGSNRDACQRWFRELQHYGFSVMTNPGCLGVDGKGKAPQWRLTELGYMGDPPTREFLRWNGTKFHDAQKQNPGRESGSRVDAKAGPLVDAKAGPPTDQSGRETGSISSHRGGRETGSISKLTTSCTKKRGTPPAPTASPAASVDAGIFKVIQK